MGIAPQPVVKQLRCMTSITVTVTATTTPIANVIVPTTVTSTTTDAATDISSVTVTITTNTSCETRWVYGQHCWQYQCHYHWN